MVSSENQCQGYKIILMTCLGLNEELQWHSVMLLSFCKGGAVCEDVVLGNVCWLFLKHEQ